jgi:hypothetical protein
MRWTFQEDPDDSDGALTAVVVTARPLVSAYRDGDDRAGLTTAREGAGGSSSDTVHAQPHPE